MKLRDEAWGARRVARVIGGRFSYANVMSTIAVFGVLAGGGAYAASKIGASDIARNAIHSKHIAKKAVKTPKIANGAVNAGRLADGAVTTAKLAGDAVTAPRIADSAVGSDQIENGSVGPSELGTIPAARVDKPLEFGVFIPNDSEVLADLGEPIFQTVPIYDSSASKFVAPIPGIYEVTAAFIWDPNATGVRRLTLKKNDSYVIGQADTAAASAQIQEVSGLVQLAADDDVGAFVYQNSGGTLGYVRDSRMHFDIRWVAPG